MNYLHLHFIHLELVLIKSLFEEFARVQSHLDFSQVDFKVLKCSNQVLVFVCPQDYRPQLTLQLVEFQLSFLHFQQVQSSIHWLKPPQVILLLPRVEFTLISLGLQNYRKNRHQQLNLRRSGCFSLLRIQVLMYRFVLLEPCMIQSYHLYLHLLIIGFPNSQHFELQFTQREQWQETKTHSKPSLEAKGPNSALEMPKGC